MLFFPNLGSYTHSSLQITCTLEDPTDFSGYHIFYILIIKYGFLSFHFFR